MRDKIFPQLAEKDIDYDHFKKKFFPHLLLIEELNERELNDNSRDERVLFDREN